MMGRYSPMVTEVAIPLDNGGDNCIVIILDVEIAGEDNIFAVSQVG
jgi:hypothetical protein